MHVNALDLNGFVNYFFSFYFKRFQLLMLRSASLFFIVNVFSGCLAYKWKVFFPAPEKVVGPKKSSLKIIKAIEGLSIELESEYKANHFVFKNNTDDILFVDFSSSVATPISWAWTSIRLVSGKTKNLNRDRVSPAEPLAPGTMAEISFYSSDKRDDLRLAKFARFRVAVRSKSLDGELKIVEFESSARLRAKRISPGFRSKTIVTPVSSGDKWGCYITAIFYGGWCWLIESGPEDEEIALEKAKEKYGEKATVRFLQRTN